MKNRFIVFSFAALAATISASRASAQSAGVTIELSAPGVSDWNVATNWTTIPDALNFVPGDGFPREVASISNGGTSFLSGAAQFPVDGVLIGDLGGESGTLEIRAGGTLNVVDGDLAEPARDGGMYVGNGGSGTLLINGGTLNAASLFVSGETTSRMTVSGAGTVNIAGNGVVSRTIRTVGPGTNINFGQSLWLIGGTEAQITAATHGAIKAPNGTAALGGTLTVDFSGVTPAFGNSWTIVDAQSTVGEFSSVTSNTELARGLVVDAVYTATGNVNAVIDNRLILNVNRGTGAVEIENAIGAAIAIDGYTIGSPLGSLLSANGTWSSLDDQNVGSFAEASPTANAISELASTDSLNFAIGGKRALGSPFNYVPTAFGVSGDDLTFEYTTPSGTIETGIVEYSGPQNNLVLTVNPETGEGLVQNQSPFTVAIDGYTISSASGSLSVAGWTSLDDQNVLQWAEANPDATALSELLPVGGFTLTPNASFSLGDLFSIAGTQDLSLEFTLADGTLFQGEVVYGEAAAPGQEGDTNGDGTVDLDDLNAVRNNFGATGAPGIPGDAFPFDGVVDLDDLNAVRNNFGAGGSSSVPEPGTFALAAAGLLAFVGIRRRSK
jgi:hypothetical protein